MYARSGSVFKYLNRMQISSSDRPERFTHVKCRMIREKHVSGVSEGPMGKESLGGGRPAQVSVIARYVDSRGLFEQYTRRCHEKPQERQYPIRPIWQES
jgi:hypothetical protein